MKLSDPGKSIYSLRLKVRGNDIRDEKTNASTNSHHEGLRHDTSEPLSKTEEREDEENPSFQEDSSERFTIRDETASVESTKEIPETNQYTTLALDYRFNEGKRTRQWNRPTVGGGGEKVTSVVMITFLSRRRVGGILG